jgi:antitoxin YqcF
VSEGPPPAHKAWFRLLNTGLPGSTKKVVRYHDETNAHHVDVLTADGDDGTIAVTIGIMDLDVSPRTPSVHTEILMDARGSHPAIANMLSTIAFCIIKDEWKPAPGVVFPSIVEMYDESLHVKHVMFTPTIQWEMGMNPVVLPGRTIHPLLAVPITNLESKFVDENGAEALERIWEARKVDVFRWTRPSAV